MNEGLVDELWLSVHPILLGSGKALFRKQHNLYFAIEDWWMSDLYSRTQMAPTYCNIVALEDSELVQISHLALEKFMEEVPTLERFFRMSYQKSLVNQHLRSLQMLSMSAEERYPKIANRIPQKHVATFLGLTPEFFNTIHAKVVRSKRKPNALTTGKL